MFYIVSGTINVLLLKLVHNFSFLRFIVCSSSFLPVVSGRSLSDGTVQVSQQLTPGLLINQPPHHHIPAIGPDSDCVKSTRINCTCEVLSVCKKCSKLEMVSRQKDTKTLFWHIKYVCWITVQLCSSIKGRIFQLS